MRPSTLVSFVALAFASVSHADIFQHTDCDGDGSLLLTELDAVPVVDLSGLYLGCADLHFANLEFAILSGADLSGANLSGAFMFVADLSGADLTNANLTYAILTNANLSNADLTNANLSGAFLDLANLSGADLSGADLSGVRSGGIVGTPINLPPEWSLRSGYLIGPGANLSGADLSGADLSNANLSGADLSGANLSGANLTGADLTGADLTGAIGSVVTIVDISVLAVDQTGSCCTNSGCASISESNCSAMGGTWTEGGSCDDCQPAADDCPADVDGDGTIGFSDVLVILNDWGACP
jgi:uncharacterized protein YjbI with pentapeptide repeats